MLGAIFPNVGGTGYSEVLLLVLQLLLIFSPSSLLRALALIMRSVLTFDDDMMSETFKRIDKLVFLTIKIVIDLAFTKVANRRI
jgi:hypothetical protein